jgi:hypothetical protein
MTTRGWLAVAMAVCGCGRTPLGIEGPDAGPMVMGGSPDASVLAPAAVVVTVDGQVAGGVDVVFHDAAGQVLATAQTDASGRASHEVPAGAWITVAHGSDVRVSVGGVQPGEVIPFRFGVPPHAAQFAAAVVTGLRPGPMPAGASYNWEIGHGGGGSGATRVEQIPPVDFSADDLSNGLLPAVATLVDSQQRVVAYSATLATPQNVGATPVDFSSWSTAMGSLHVDVTGVPIDATSTTLGASALFHGVSTGGQATPLATPASAVDLTYEQDIADALMLDATAQWNPSDVAMAFWQVSTGGALGVDLSAALPPRISNLTVVGDEVRWSSGADLSALDVMQVDLVGGGGPPWTLVFAPGSSSALHLPQLPPELALTAAPTYVWLGALKAGVDYDTRRRNLGSDAFATPDDGSGYQFTFSHW